MMMFSLRGGCDLNAVLIIVTLLAACHPMHSCGVGPLHVLAIVSLYLSSTGYFV